MYMRDLRIQRKQAKGFRLPKGTICVTRPGPWGNPFGSPGIPCANLFRDWLAGEPWVQPKPRLEGRRQWILDHVHELCGKLLACWCRPQDECHADVLIALANPELRIFEENAYAKKHSTLNNTPIVPVFFGDYRKREKVDQTCRQIKFSEVIMYRETPVKVNAWVDQKIAPLISALNVFKNVQTLDSCQGEENMSPYVYFTHRDGGEQTVAFVQHLSSLLNSQHVLLNCKYTLQLEWGGSIEQIRAKINVQPEHMATLAEILVKIATNFDHANLPDDAQSHQSQEEVKG